MHAIAFGAKRVFHSFLRVTRRPFLSWPGLTAARFDLMSAFFDEECEESERPSCVELRQSELRRALGVCASVVSRMVRALRERGWVARRREPADRRGWTLTLTPSGEEVIRGARRLMLRAVKRIVDDAFCLFWRRGRRHAFSAVNSCMAALDTLRLHFADRATLEYPWWPNVDH